MTRREKLQEAYEDALFALLMEDVIEAEGERLRKENERLKLDPSAGVPEKLNRRCLETIRRSYGRGRRKGTGEKIGRVTWSVCSKAAVVIVICMLLFTAAFAASPDLRARTLNLLVEISDINAVLTIGENEKPEVSYDTSEAAQKVYEYFGYRIPELPEEYVLEKETVGQRIASLRYGLDSNSSITFCFTKTSGGKHGVDIENADSVEDISIAKFEGMIVEKDGRTQVAWADIDREVLVSIVVENCSEKMVWDIVDALVSNVD